ncbi:MAG: hypothetical protein IT488_11735 [Gammaproteobacteria bacterium]|nr:hypothetical protein [Gammaproteobacteria bacterium]
MHLDVLVLTQPQGKVIVADAGRGQWHNLGTVSTGPRTAEVTHLLKLGHQVAIGSLHHSRPISRSAVVPCCRKPAAPIPEIACDQPARIRASDLRQPMYHLAQH